MYPMSGKADLLLPWSIYRQVVGRMGRSWKAASEQWVRRTSTMRVRCKVAKVEFYCFPALTGKVAWAGEGRKLSVGG